MSDLNTVIIQGRIVNNARIRFIPSGKKVADFTIATNRARRTADGNYEDIGEFFNVSTFVNSDKQARHFVQGQPLIVEGFLKQDRWETDDGQKRTQNNIGVRRIYLIFSKREKDINSLQPLPESEKEFNNDEEMIFENENYSEDIFVGDGEPIYR